MKKFATILIAICICFISTPSLAQAKIQVHQNFEKFSNEILIMLTSKDETVRQAGINKWENEINNTILFFVFCSTKPISSCKRDEETKQFILPANWEKSFSEKMLMNNETYKVVTALAKLTDLAKTITNSLQSQDELLIKITMQMWQHNIIHFLITMEQNGVDP